jgi:hypothetical protein
MPCSFPRQRPSGQGGAAIAAGGGSLNRRPQAVNKRGKRCSSNRSPPHNLISLGCGRSPPQVNLWISCFSAGSVVSVRGKSSRCGGPCDSTVFDAELRRSELAEVRLRTDVRPPPAPRQRSVLRLACGEPRRTADAVAHVRATRSRCIGIAFWVKPPSAARRGRL